MKKLVVAILFVIPLLFVACDKGEDEIPAATPYTLVIPQGLPPMNIPSTNPLTVEGVALGKRLFTILFYLQITRKAAPAVIYKNTDLQIPINLAQA